jgi:hypothetical protein
VADRYPATLGTRERLATIVAAGLTVVGFTVVGIVVTARTGELPWLFIGLPFSIFMFVLGRYAPVAYRLESDGIHVERRAPEVVIPYGRIRAVDRERRHLQGMSFAGSKGIFGRFGRFWNSQLGWYSLYLSNTEGIVWLATDGGWVGLSPDTPDEFVRHLQGRLARSR